MLLVSLWPDLFNPNRLNCPTALSSPLRLPSPARAFVVTPFAYPACPRVCRNVLRFAAAFTAARECERARERERTREMGSGRRTNGAMEEMLSLVWCNPLVTGTVLLLLFTPPFFPLLVYFSPLLMTTALWAAALVSIGPWQIEKQPIEAEREEEEEEGSNYCVDRQRRRRRQDDASGAWIYWSGGGGEVVRSGMWSSGELLRASAETVHGAAAQQRRTTTPASNEFMEEKDRWTMWVKEYETRLEWNQATAAPSQDGGFAAAVKREQEMRLEKESLKLETQKFKERFNQLATELSTGDTVQILTCLFCPLKPKK